jgi:flagellar basal-body rod modification protein FlgD
MVTKPISSPVNQGQTSTTKSTKPGLQASDFINMMVTQLQNQDPTQPTSNQELLTQMSQISQLQSSTDLSTTLKSVLQQSQLGSAAGLIGKPVHGLDTDNTTISGQVTSVSVTTDGTNLELDSGKSLPLSRVTTVGGAAAAPAASTGTTTTPAVH